MYIILLAGMPASGKSTIAARISREFHLPVLEKDAIKEVLFDTLGFSCYAEKRKLDHVANALLLQQTEVFIRSGNSVILDNNFDSIAAEKYNALVEKYGCKCVTVFLDGETEAFYKRYVARDAAHARHLGHILQEHYPPQPGDSLDHTMTPEEFDEKFVKRGMREVRLAGHRIDLDATRPEAVDLEGLIADLHRFIEE